MRVYSRLKRLERISDVDDKIWAVFSINYYENTTEKEMAQQRLINDYLSEGKKAASYYLFINEIPGPTDACYEEKLLCLFKA